MQAARARLVSAAVLAAASLVHAQQGPPQFRAEINYVEVDARVVDEQGRQIRGLTQRDFAVFEDGVRQSLTNFSVVDIPVPAAALNPLPAPGVKPDTASNVQGGGRRRTYLIVLDDASIDLRWTNPVRAFLQRFIERSVGPDDLVGVATTGTDRAYENFTTDKARSVAAVRRMIGQGESPAMKGLTGGAGGLDKRAALESGRLRGETPNVPIADATTAAARNAQRDLVQMIHALSSAGSGSKAIIYVSQGIPFEMVTDTEGLTLGGDVERVSAQARRSNVPIYPVDPRGLSSGGEQAVEVPIVGLNDSPNEALSSETRRGQDSLRHLADDSGGFPIVGLNDINGGLERIAALSSYYYVLGYYSTNTRRDGKYRKINVTVDRPGARALNRRGYTAAVTGGSKGLSLAGPPKSSVELREALNSVLPGGDLPLQMSAAAFRQINRRASVAVVMETPGSGLVWQNDVLAAPLELTATALDKRGAIKTGDVETLRISTRSDMAARVRQYGFRWVARLDDLNPGRYQIRGAAANGSAKQGSVWYDVDVPDFAKTPLAMSDVVLASQVAMLRPTLRPDKQLLDVLPGPPTTLRDFREGGNFAIYAEVYDNQLDRAHEVEAVITVSNERGEIVYRTSETRTNRQIADTGGVFGLRIGIPLVKTTPGRYVLSIEARQKGTTATTSRVVPFTVMPAGT